MSLASLRATILDKVDDPRLFDTGSTTASALVDDMIYKAVTFYSARVILPALEQYDSVELNGATTATNTVALPDDYQRNLFYCNDGTTDRGIFSSAGVMKQDAAMLSEIPCTVSGGSLLFNEDIAEDITFYLGYQRAPEATEIDVFPPGFDEWPIIWFCCWQFFDDIEDGDDGKTPNTKKYEGRTLQSVVELNSLLQGSQPRPRAPRISGWI